MQTCAVSDEELNKAGKFVVVPWDFYMACEELARKLANLRLRRGKGSEEDIRGKLGLPPLATTRPHPPAVWIPSPPIPGWKLRLPNADGTWCRRFGVLEWDDE